MPELGRVRVFVVSLEYPAGRPSIHRYEPGSVPELGPSPLHGFDCCTIPATLMQELDRTQHSHLAEDVVMGCPPRTPHRLPAAGRRVNAPCPHGAAGGGWRCPARSGSCPASFLASMRLSTGAIESSVSSAQDEQSRHGSQAGGVGQVPVGPGDLLHEAFAANLPKIVGRPARPGGRGRW